MSAKQDRQGARTPADLERKYNFGKQFAEILGIATDARNYATLIEAELSERYTMMLRDTESIIMEAVSQCATEEELEYTVSTQLSEADSDLNSKFNELYSYISMVGGILTFSDSVSTRTLALNNGRIQFADSGVVFGEWDGDNFYTGNLVIRVSERAQFGNFAYVPRTDGSLMFLKVGG